MTAEYSPLPWAVKTARFLDVALVDVVDAAGDGVCEFINSSEGIDNANAAFIVLAVNAYEALLAAAKEFIPPVPSPNALCHASVCAQEDCAWCSRIMRAHAAIAQAEAR